MSLTNDQKETATILRIVEERDKLIQQNTVLSDENIQLRHLNNAASREASRQAVLAEQWRAEAERWRRIAAHPDEMDNFPAPHEVVASLRILHQNPHFRRIAGLQ